MIGPRSAENRKIFSKVARQTLDGGRSETIVEIALPWSSLLPFDPVAGHPVKMNLAVHDKDGDGLDQVGGALAYTPGLVGVFSGAHFPTLRFDPPKGSKGVAGFAQVPAFHYLNQKIEADVSLRNFGAEVAGKLQLLAAPGREPPLAEREVKIPSGLSAARLAVESEAVGKNRLALMARLVVDGAKPVEFPVFAPRAGNAITIQTLAEIERRVVAFEKDFAALSNLYARVEAAGLDTAYPKAYLTLMKMFLPLCRDNLKRGDSERVVRNTDHLKIVYAEAAAYMEGALRDPARQFKLPPKLVPGTLRIRDGYWRDGDRPVFLWGPCVFWYLKDDQPLVVDLGFNSVCTEVPMRLGATNALIQAHMEYWRTNGVHVNASMHVPDLQLTGADVRASKLLQEHPELKNLDPNNFLPFVIQHPVAREKIDQGFRDSIAFWRHFKGVGSYWLWNEPWYLNYSEMTRRDFVEAMKRKYKTVEALNARWKSDLKDFEDIRLVTWPDPKNTAPWYDFQQFRDDLLVDFFGFLNTTAKRFAPGMPTHAKFMSPSLHSFSIERLQGLYDIAGHDGNSGDHHIPFLDFCNSVYPGKPLANTEVHIWYGGKTSVERVAWRLALHGLADGNWWCWHSDPRFSDSISNAESMHALTFSGLDIQRLFDPWVHAVARRPAPFATLFPDVVERRSDMKLARIRFEIARPQYALGIRPFYATETRIASGELDRHAILFAGESGFVKDATYAKVLAFVKRGGTVIVTRGGFAQNEYGDPRDASELVRPEAGEPYGEHARVYPLGKGQVVCIAAIDMLEDLVKDGSVSMGGPGPEGEDRRRVYHRVVAKLLADRGLAGAVRLVPGSEAARDDPDAMLGYDWGVAEVDGAYVLAALPGKALDVNLETVRPVRRIVDLIRGVEVPVGTFALEKGPNLFHIDLKQGNARQ